MQHLRGRWDGPSIPFGSLAAGAILGRWFTRPPNQRVMPTVSGLRLDRAGARDWFGGYNAANNILFITLSLSFC